MFPLNRQKTILDPTLPDVIIEFDILLFISKPTPDQLSFFGGFSECIMSFWLSLQEWVSVRHKMSLSSFSAMYIFICDNPWQFQVPNLRVQASEMCFWLDKMDMIRRNKWGNGIIPVIGRFWAGSLFAESRVLAVFVCVCWWRGWLNACAICFALCLSSLPVYSKKSPVSNPGGRQTIEMMGGRHTITITITITRRKTEK